MKAVMRKEDQNFNEEQSWQELDSYARKAAEGIRPGLQNSDIEGYKRFLDMMYHYTLRSGDKLKAIADNSPNEELRDYFNHMYLEERNHYMLAQQDLKGFGLTPNAKTPQEIHDMDKFWDSLNGGHINGYLGALYVFDKRIVMTFNKVGASSTKRAIIGHCAVCQSQSEQYVNCKNPRCNRHFIACSNCLGEDGKVLCPQGCLE